MKIGAAELRDFAVSHTAAWHRQDTANLAVCYSPGGSLPSAMALRQWGGVQSRKSFDHS
jgi:hypothetical protein